mgnify:CR=1 FL=1
MIYCDYKEWTEERPVYCFFCGKHMYYKGDPKFEDEYNLTLTGLEGRSYEAHYIHQRCWHALLELISSFRVQVKGDGKKKPKRRIEIHDAI